MLLREACETWIAHPLEHTGQKSNQQKSSQMTLSLKSRNPKSFLPNNVTSFASMVQGIATVATSQTSRFLRFPFLHLPSLQMKSDHNLISYGCFAACFTFCLHWKNMTTEVAQRMVPLEDARPLKRARKVLHPAH
eukprot:g48364.t1